MVEIGCLELVNRIPSGRSFQTYVNPERAMPDDAFEVHGLGDAFLADKPVFAAVAADFLDFLGDTMLVIHNAQFDLGFLNAELDRLGRPRLTEDRAIDTVQLARRRFPGAPASLDALCKRFGVDNAARTRHGALLDAELLAEVYLELIGGRQPSLWLAASGAERRESEPRALPARVHEPSPEERAAHEAFVDTLTDPIWKR